MRGSETKERERGTDSEVTLVADEHYGHVGVGVLPRILQPAGQMVEGFPPAIGVH